MNKDIKIYLILVVIILAVIAGIYYFKNIKQTTPEENTIKCIAKNAVMYSQTDCSHCKQQKQILGEYQSLFNIIECDKETDLCMKKEIIGTPTWEINGKFYPGIKSIKELADLTNCECNANVEVIKNNSIESCNINTTQECTIPVDNICSK
jgi:glutaredoxin